MADSKHVYWLSPLGEKDDFGRPYKDEMIDGRTKSGPWANMTLESWMLHGCGKYGTGFAQRYRRQSNGRWLKVEG
jgi:hypothetical protein